MSGIAGELRDLRDQLEHHDPSSSPGVIARGLRQLVGALLEHFGPGDEQPDPDPDAKDTPKPAPPAGKPGTGTGSK
jgi:hypothetical protein